MPNISLPNGKVIYVSTYDYYFQLEEKDVDEFFQSCMADDLGSHIDDPFSQKASFGKLEVEELPDIENDDIIDPDSIVDQDILSNLIITIFCIFIFQLYINYIYYI